MKVLLTGAAGQIGQVLLLGLTDRGHEIVGVDRLPAPEGWEGAWHTADVADPDAVLDAVAAQPIDAIVHLAGHPGDSSLPDALTSHVLTTAALLEGAIARGVTRFVYASSNHAVGLTPRGDEVSTLTPPRPDTFYGVGKVAAEALMRLYVDRHGLDAVACRIGSFHPEPQSVRQLATWLSYDDCVRMIEAALTATAPGFAVCYGISDNTRAWWDLEPGRALGYQPQDDAEAWADTVPIGPDDDAEDAFVGGPYALPSAARPAF